MRNRHNVGGYAASRSVRPGNALYSIAMDCLAGILVSSGALTVDVNGPWNPFSLRLLRTARLAGATSCSKKRALDWIRQEEFGEAKHPLGGSCPLIPGNSVTPSSSALVPQTV